MPVMNIHQAKTHLSRLLEQVAAGEEVIIARAGKPVARIVPYEKPAEPRKPGLLKGQIWTAPGWDQPDEDVVESFYNSSVFPETADSKDEAKK